MAFGSNQLKWSRVMVIWETVLKCRKRKKNINQIYLKNNNNKNKKHGYLLWLQNKFILTLQDLISG